MLTKEFFFAGRAVWTVANKQTGKHFTFKLRIKSDPQYGKTMYISERIDSGWGYVGILRKEDWTVVLTKASVRRDHRLSPTDTVVKAINWFFFMLKNEREWPEYIEIKHEGKCGRCGRALTHPDSLKTGIGPDCAGRVGQESTKAKSYTVYND